MIIIPKTIILEISTHNKQVRRQIETSKLTKSKLITRNITMKSRCENETIVIESISFNIERIVFNDAIDIIWDYFEHDIVRTTRKGHWVMALACYLECHDFMTRLKKMS